MPFSELSGGERATEAGNVPGLVDRAFESVPRVDFLAYAVECTGLEAGSLPRDWQEWVAEQDEEQELFRRLAPAAFADVKAPEEELSSYVHEAVSLSGEFLTVLPRGGTYFREQKLREIVGASGSLEELKLSARLFGTWRSVVKEADSNGVRGKKLDDFLSFIKGMSGRGAVEVEPQFKTFLEIKTYVYSLMFGGAKTEGNRALGFFDHHFFVLADEWHDPHQAELFFEIFKQHVHAGDQDLAFKFLYVVYQCSRRHKLTPESQRGFEGKLLADLASHSADVGVLDKFAENIWAKDRNSTAAGDFVVHCYGVEVTPKNNHALLDTARQMPTHSASRLLQNREYGVALDEPFGRLRELVHDQKPLVRAVVPAMLAYYRTHDPSELTPLIRATGADYLDTPENAAKILDLSKYDSDVTIQKSGEYDEHAQPVKAIEVLERLANNLKLSREEPPTVSDEKLSECLSKLGSVELLAEDALLPVLDRLNVLLAGAVQEREVGVRPTTILAAEYVERCAFEVLQNLSYERQQSCYREPWFVALLKFQELTASGLPFDEAEFERFIGKVSRQRQAAEAFKLIQRRTLDNIYSLAKDGAAESAAYDSGALWSGNVAHELISLTDARPAVTAYGEKHAAENETPFWLRNTGD